MRGTYSIVVACSDECCIWVLSGLEDDAREVLEFVTSASRFEKRSHCDYGWDDMMLLISRTRETLSRC